MLPSISSLSATISNTASILNPALNAKLDPAGAGGFSIPSLNSSSVAGETPFSSLLSDAVGQVSALETQARGAVQGLMSGSGVDVHQAMIATEKAGMAFEMALAVRNKAVQAYQSVIGMQF